MNAPTPNVTAPPAPLTHPAPAQAKPPAPAPARGPAPRAPGIAAASRRTLQITTGKRNLSPIVAIYGTGGIGKTELAANSAQAGYSPLLIDLEDGSSEVDVPRIAAEQGEDPMTFEDTRAVLQDYARLDPFDLIAMDTLTEAERLTSDYTIRTTGAEKSVESIEGFGYGKGYKFLMENFELLLSDLDQLRRRGKTIVVIMHECTDKVPNPEGADWIRYEPRMQKTPNANLRQRVKEWADHLLCIRFDIYADKKGKGQGGGSRTIYTQESPVHMAKSRGLVAPMAYEKGSAVLWHELRKLQAARG